MLASVASPPVFFAGDFARAGDFPFAGLFDRAGDLAGERPRAGDLPPPPPSPPPAAERPHSVDIDLRSRENSSTALRGYASFQ